MNMAHEVETKVLGIQKESVIETLESLGAKKLQDTRLVVDWYRPVTVKEGEDEWFLRIRSDSGGAHEVTWKARSDIIGKVRKHKEINFFIQDAEKLADLFLEIGLEQYAHQEKDRISFSLEDWQFDIDTYPGMEPFLEIEGASEESVHEAIEMLSLENNDTWAKGERILIQDIYGLNWYNMRFN